MKLLILTQKVDKNDDILGFFHEWLREFSSRVEKLTVICLQNGEYDLPGNVTVVSLGKESEASRFKYILKFYRYIFQFRNDYDSVFVHMNPIYFVFGGFFWKILGKRTALWYTHRNIDWKLKIAERLADVIFTASKESFQLESSKVKVIGHGIPIERFLNPQTNPVFMPGGSLRMISVGRITPIKNLDILIEAANILKDRIADFQITLVGGTTNESDEKYLEKLKSMIEDYHIKDKIIFTGSVPNHKIREFYWKSDISINLAPLGGLDKAVLESISSGLPVLVCNKTFVGYLGEFENSLLFREYDAEDLADKIIKLAASDKLNEIRSYLLEQVKRRSGLPELITKIVAELK